MDLYAAVDVHYTKEKAITALVEFPDFSAGSITGTLIQDFKITSPYIPGKFYLRELPCILRILEMTKKQYKSIVIDGFVYLKKPLCLGLGGYLAGTLAYQTTIIGIAKNYFGLAERFVEIKRGRSSKPLYVSSSNMELPKAGEMVKNMYGNYRIPYILKITDLLSKNLINNKLLNINKIY